MQAAKASECAAEQGRFDQFHDTLFGRQDSIGKISWSSFAARSEVANRQAFDSCMNAPAADSAVARDIAASNALAVRVTPTFLIQDLRLEGALPLDTLKRYLSTAMKLSAR